MTTVATSARTDQYCTFWVAGLYLGVAVCDVQEVLRAQPMTVVPRAPETVVGLVNLRGSIVPALDLRRRLGLPRAAPVATGLNVVVRSRGETVSLLVDEIGDVAQIEGAVEAVPSTVPAAVRDVLHGVIPLPDAILLVLDADRVGDVPVPGAPTVDVPAARGPAAPSLTGGER